MNPISLLADADKLSISQLQQSVQNGTIPAYIGVPLIQEKIKSRERMMAAQANQNAAPTTPVAQQVLQQAQGVDALPVERPETYASGGIVAFDNGGKVYSRFGTGLTENFLGFEDTPAFEDLVRKIGYSGAMQMVRDNLAQGASGVASLYTKDAKDFDSRLGNPYDRAARKANDVYNQGVSGLTDLSQQATGLYDRAARKANDVYNQGITGLTDAFEQVAPFSRAPEAKIMPPQSAPAEGTTDTNMQFANPAQAARDILNEPAKAKTDPELYQWAVGYQKTHPDTAEASGFAEDDARIAAMRGRKITPEQATATATAGYTTPYGAALNDAAVSSYKDLLSPERSAQEYRAEREAALGKNTGIDSLRKELATMQGSTEKDREQAGWLALMQAGLATMGGTSPNALVNIGQGAQTGLAAYGKAQDSYERAQGKYFDISAKLEDAQRKEAEAAFRYGEDSAQRDKEANRAVKLAERKEAAALNLEQLKQGSPENMAQAEYYKAKAVEAADPRSSAFKEGVELRGAAELARKALDDYKSTLSLVTPEELAKDATYQRLVKEAEDARAAHLKFIQRHTGAVTENTPPSDMPPPNAKIRRYDQYLQR